MKTPFYKNWEVQFVTPVFTILFTTGYHIGCLYLLYPKFGLEGKIISYIQSVIYILSLWGFFNTVFTGPGYFPFYWANKDVRFNPNTDSETAPMKNTGENDLAGVISHKRQLKWAKKQPRPPRSMVSASARRIVIRPDHFCIWTQVWIGKRNNKLFILFTGYAFLFALVITIYTARLYVSEIISGGLHFSITRLLHLGYILLPAYFSLFAFSFSFTTLIMVFKGYTMWEDYNKISVNLHKGTIRENIEDVFGPISKWYTYLIPISPFSNMTNEQLVSKYHSYYDENLDKITDLKEPLM